MAHAARIAQLIEGLVSSTTGQTKGGPRFKQWKDQTTRALGTRSHSRTNQFDVESKYFGLIEKFAILNREDLSDALQARLRELPSGSTWLPEVLSLLLQLSNRPLQKTKLEDIEALAGRVEEKPTLTWEEIIADDPLDEPGVWDVIERGSHSSGDEAIIDDLESEHTTLTQTTSLGDETGSAFARLHVVQVDESALDVVEANRAHLNIGNTNGPPSELQLIRESLLMLRGWPTHLYSIHESCAGFSLNTEYHLKTTSSQVIHSLLNQLGEVGWLLSVLRQWSRSRQRGLFLQSCQAAVQRLLMKFGSDLADMERKYLRQQGDVVISIIETHADIGRMAHPLTQLSRIVQASEERQKVNSPFTLLDALYIESCVAQMSGDSELYSILANVLSEGCKTYLKPLGAWMQTGFLNAGDESLPVTSADSKWELGSLWHKRYKLRTLTDGQAFAPLFMYSHIHKIFAIGKSQAFLRALRNTDDSDVDEEKMFLPDFSAINETLLNNSLLPFSQLFDDTLKSWMAKAASDCSPLLHPALFHEHGIFRELVALQNIFCSRDGRLFQVFADVLFWRIQSVQKTWQDRLLLTELAQTTLGTAEGVISQNLSVGLIIDDQYEKLSLSSIRQLEAISMEYLFSWPLQNITRSIGSRSYGKAFVLLLQIYRAKHLIRSTTFDMRKLDTRAANASTNVSAALKLRQRLIWIVETLYSYATGTANELGTSLLKTLETAEDIDAMAMLWAEHEKTLEVSLLLAQTLKPVRDALTRILELCEVFMQTWAAIIEPMVSIQPETESDEDQDFADASEHQEPPLSTQTSIVHFQNDLDKSLSFVKAGLRGISRAGGNTALETLTEILELSVH